MSSSTKRRGKNPSRKSDRTTISEEEVVKILSPEVTLVSFISTQMNHVHFLDYIENLDLSKLSQIIITDKEGNESNIKKDDSIFYIFILALLYKNENMYKFIYDILHRTGNNIQESEFKTIIEEINKFLQYRTTGSNIKGGTTLKQLLYELGIIGAFIYIAFYNYFIITSGVWTQFYETAEKITEVGQKISSGCGRYIPSKNADFLTKYGFGYYGIGNPDMVFKIDSVIQCLLTPTALSSNLREIYSTKANEEILTGLFKELSTSHSNIFPTREAAEPMGKELVVSNPTFTQFGLIIKKGENEIDIEQTIRELQKLGEMQKDEFETYFSRRMTPPTQPVEPIVEPSSVIGYLSTVTTFMADLYDVVKDLNAENVAKVSSLSAQNAIIYSIQDMIKINMRKIEDMRTDLKRKVEDEITYATRLVSELNSLPSVVLKLFSLNTTAFFIFLYFTNKIKRMLSSKTGDETLAIEYQPSTNGDQPLAIENVSSSKSSSKSSSNSSSKKVVSFRKAKGAKRTQGSQKRAHHLGGKKNNNISKKKR